MDCRALPTRSVRRLGVAMLLWSRVRLVLAAGTLAFAVLSLAGCGSPTPQGPLELTSADKGSTQRLAVGQELRVTLESNPTTGYRWAVDGDLPTQLEQMGEPSYKAESKMVGAGGQEVWAFKGAKAGTADLKLKYWRSFEPTAQPAETFSVTVEVK